MLKKTTRKHNTYHISYNTLKHLAYCVYMSLSRRTVIVDSEELMNFISFILANCKWDEFSANLPVYACLPKQDAITRMSFWLSERDFNLTEMDCLDVFNEAISKLSVCFTYHHDLDNIKINPLPAYTQDNDHDEPNIGCIIINPLEKLVNFSPFHSAGAQVVIREYEYTIRISGGISGEDLYKILTDEKFASCVDDICQNWQLTIKDGVLEGYLTDQDYERLRFLEKRFFKHESINES